MANLISVALIFAAAILAYGFRRRIMEPFRRFEARNAQRRADEARAMFDRFAHYRKTVEFAEEQVAAVEKITVPDERTGEPVARYLFLGEQFATRKDAESRRFAAVIERARDFYQDLDRIYLSRRGRGGREPPSAGPGLPSPPQNRDK